MADTISKINKAFCVLPFVHTHLNTEGDVFPCCVGWTPEKVTSLGYLKDNTLEELFNSPKLKQLRVDMVNGVRRDDFCTACFQREDNGFVSAREGNNSDFKDEIEDIISQMEPDGTMPEVIKSWDIRYSNLCNLKCRTCGDIYSTTWSRENEQFDGQPYQEFVSYEGEDPLEKQYGNVEKIYFAGGEPLIMPQHYQTLQRLIDSGRSKKVKLVYNTNMTKLYYNKHNIIDMWLNFREVSIGLSIDNFGERAEYIRNGVKWKQIENNLKMLSDASRKNPKISIHYTPTVSLMNVYTLPDLHRFLVENNYMPHANSMLLNLLIGPPKYSMRILPDDIKAKVKQKISEHIEWMKTQPTDYSSGSELINTFSSVISYLDQPIDNREKALQEFILDTKKLDARRNQSFSDTFPEYKDWWEDISKNIIAVSN